MIAKKYRTPRRLIDFILKKGESYNSRLFLIRGISNQEPFYRYRVIVSKKIHPKAVKRNHLRRQIYEAIRTTESTKSIINPDLILIPKKRILKSTYLEIAHDIRNIKKITWKNSTKS